MAELFEDDMEPTKKPSFRDMEFQEGQRRAIGGFLGFIDPKDVGPVTSIEKTLKDKFVLKNGKWRPRTETKEISSLESALSMLTEGVGDPNTRHVLPQKRNIAAKAVFMQGYKPSIKEKVSSGLTQALKGLMLPKSEAQRAREEGTADVVSLVTGGRAPGSIEEVGFLQELQRRQMEGTLGQPIKKEQQPMINKEEEKRLKELADKVSKRGQFI